jgi:hypothetical protein
MAFIKKNENLLLTTSPKELIGLDKYVHLAIDTEINFIFILPVLTFNFILSYIWTCTTVYIILYILYGYNVVITFMQMK